jgi:uncharacterized protein (TIGR02598 family)
MQYPRSAFSLVEVVLALGILSVGFLAIVGLLPVSLAIFRQSSEDTVSTQIVQQILTESQQTPFSRLATINGDRFYTDEGFPATASDFVYSARVSLLPGVTEVPAASGAAGLGRTRTVKLEIAKNQTIARLTQEGRTKEINVRSFFVSDVGL